MPPTYEEVLTLAQHLPPDDQVRLLQALTTLVYPSVEVEGSDEVISAKELSESEMAWQDYQSGRDLGISSEELKLKLFGR
ncbi:MAG: hypothetical protein HC840_24975 [Leptolyngbyaceae cyanobacterium RM2_2_4]|nr:hypothetical protein [Leptolyngbyaceae cyanobacterium SM1_4_3]NJN90981.1 hypothetical protein [Leptolyngbyaceae cyanobacterium SL_5_14]NJO52115.1 hypothetical protein [Leptolyngbyaceae cyanobacterium RM2_2_4]